MVLCKKKKKEKKSVVTSFVEESECSVCIIYGKDEEGRMICFGFGSGRISIVQASKTAWQDQQFSSISNPITASTKKPKNKFFL